MRKRVPLILTMDLEFAPDHDKAEQEDILGRINEDLSRIGAPLTIFTTCGAMEMYKKILLDFAGSGNEIGCHGIKHDKKENYRNLSYDEISYNIKMFGQRYEELFGMKPRCFRGPFMSTSSETQKVLVENGYFADYSVCQRRLDFFISSGGDIRWLKNHRIPYKPDEFNPFKKGNMPLWVVPLSGFGIPFISGTMYLIGLNKMRRFFNLLYDKCLQTEGPVVYLFHSYEFARYTGIASNGKRAKPIHQRIYIKDVNKRYDINIDLIKFMLSFDSIEPCKAGKFVNTLGGVTNSTRT